MASQDRPPPTQPNSTNNLVILKLIELLSDVKSKCQEHTRRTQMLQDNIISIKEMVQEMLPATNEQLDPGPDLDSTPQVAYIQKIEIQIPDSTDSSEDHVGLQSSPLPPPYSYAAEAEPLINQESVAKLLVDDFHDPIPGPSSNAPLNQPSVNNGDEDFINSLLDISNEKGYIPLSQNKAHSPPLTQPAPSRRELLKVMKHEQDFTKLPQFACLCPFCKDKTFSSLQNLTEHIDRYSKEWKFCCPICLQQFYGRNEMCHHLKRRHSAYMTGYQSFGCDNCGSLFSSQKELVFHQNKFRNCETEFTEPPTVFIHGRDLRLIAIPEEKIKCYCGEEEFSSESALQEHVEKATKKCKVECNNPECGKRFITQEEYLHHLEKDHKQPSLAKLFMKRSCSLENDRPTTKRPRESTEGVSETRTEPLLASFELPVLSPSSVIEVDEQGRGRILSGGLQTAHSNNGTIPFPSFELPVLSPYAVIEVDEQGRGRILSGGLPGTAQSNINNGTIPFPARRASAYQTQPIKKDF